MNETMTHILTGNVVPMNREQALKLMLRKCIMIAAPNNNAARDRYPEGYRFRWNQEGYIEWDFNGTWEQDANRFFGCWEFFPDFTDSATFELFADEAVAFFIDGKMELEVFERVINALLKLRGLRNGNL